VRWVLPKQAAVADAEIGKVPSSASREHFLNAVSPMAPCFLSEDSLRVER